MNKHLPNNANSRAVPSFTPVRTGILQRKCSCGSHTVAGDQCSDCSKKKLQRKANSEQTQGTVPSIVHDVLSSPGQPLDAQTRAFMEPRFGQDFSAVRIHTDSRAAESARAVNALAYTVGSNVVFGSGQHSPVSESGRRLMAHELTHTIQQRGLSASLNMQSAGIGAVDSPLEREADAVADKVVYGGITRVSTGTAYANKIQRQPATGGGASNQNKAMQDGVAYEKWSPEVEYLYRKMGDPRGADIARCRTEGKTACVWLLTPDEVNALYKLAGEAKGDKQKIQSQLPKVLPTLGLLGPMPTGPVTMPPIPGLPPAPVTTPVVPGAGLAAGEAGAAATAAAVAAVALIVIVLVVAGYQLYQLGKFQRALEEQGFILLDDALQYAICHACHSSPAPGPAPGKFDFPRIAPKGPGEISDGDQELLRRWLDQEPKAPVPLPVKEKTPEPDQRPKPTTDVGPVPQPKEDDRRRRSVDMCFLMWGLSPGINARWQNQRPAVAGNTTVSSAAFRLDKGINPPAGQDPTPASQRWVRAIGLPKDDAGHVIANRFGGRADFNSPIGNIFPQDLSFNRGTMRSYDSVAAGLHQSGCDVCVHIDLNYDSATSLRPSSALYTILFRSVGATGFNPPITGLVPNP